jgi:hypothetical protein
MPHQQPHHVSPEAGMWNDMIIFDQIMRSRSAGSRRPSGPGHNGGGSRPAAGDRNGSSSSTSSPSNGSGLNSVRPQAKLAKSGGSQPQPKTSSTSGSSQKPSNEAQEKAAKAKSAAATKEMHHQEHPGRHPEPAKTQKAHKRPLGADQSTISLLRTAQMKLSKADHDYAGHRVQAMHHVAHALGQLTGSTAFNEAIGYSAGNLPQAESDRLLREAEGHLNFIERTLSTRTNALEHHHTARTSVAEAIHELRTALAIR